MNIPEGWILVPKVPTEKQIKAAKQEHANEWNKVEGAQRASDKNVYAAMINSAPQYIQGIQRQHFITDIC